MVNIFLSQQHFLNIRVFQDTTLSVFTFCKSYV